MPDQSLKSSHTTNGELVGLGPRDMGYKLVGTLWPIEGLGLQVTVPHGEIGGFTLVLLIRGYAVIIMVSLSASPQPTQVSWVDLGSRTDLPWASWE